MTLFPLGAYSVKCKGFTGIHHADTLLRKFRLSERRAREHGDRLRVALTRSPSLCAALTAAWKIRSTPRMWRAAKKKNDFTPMKKYFWYGLSQKRRHGGKELNSLAVCANLGWTQWRSESRSGGCTKRKLQLHRWKNANIPLKIEPRFWVL